MEIIGNFVDTDLGLFSADNFNYLKNIRVLNSDGNIISSQIPVEDVPTMCWSMYDRFCDEYANLFPVSIHPDRNQITELLRTGECKVLIKVDGRELTEIVRAKALPGLNQYVYKYIEFRRGVESKRRAEKKTYNKARKTDIVDFN